MLVSRKTKNWKHLKKMRNKREADYAKERPRNRCQICWGFKGNSCTCNMYEWGPCVHGLEQWAPHKAWFLKGHVGDPDFYASC